MLRILKKLFTKKNMNLPCNKTGQCPYTYDSDSDRDIEGMPFVDGDERSCPEYGHICPEYMEDFNLTVDELNIRAIIHCASVMDNLVETGKVDPASPQHLLFMAKYKETIDQYPIDKYPQYYA